MRPWTRMVTLVAALAVAMPVGTGPAGAQPADPGEDPEPEDPEPEDPEPEDPEPEDPEPPTAAPVPVPPPVLPQPELPAPELPPVKPKKKKAEPKAGDEATYETRSYLPIAYSGLALFGASWIATIVVAAVADVPKRGVAVGHSVVPVGGPFLMSMEGSGPPDLGGLLIGLGVAQAFGALATFVGFTVESHVDSTRVSVGPTGVVARF